MITAKDVADALRISISTVGRAMADDPRISQKTRLRVQQAAARMGYVGNIPARIIRGGSSNLIGLILPDVRNDFYSAIAQALSACADSAGFRLVLSIANDDPQMEARHVRELVGARVAGIIVVPTARPLPESSSLLAQVPHVQLLRRVSSLGDAWFGIDDAAALRAATAHLLAQGHQHIAYIGGHETLSTGAARLSGFRSALKPAGIKAAKLLQRLGPPTVEFGQAATQSLLAAATRPTAIVTGSVHVTLGMIDFLERTAIAVPEEISIVGFGNPTWFAWWRGGLTTISPPIENLATSCGRWFLDRVRRGSPLSSHAQVTPSTLVLRASTCPPSRIKPHKSRK